MGMIGWLLNVLRNLMRAARNAALFLTLAWMLWLACIWLIVTQLGG